MTPLRRRRALLRIVGALVLAYVALTVVRVAVRRYYLFIPDYVRWTLTPTPSHAGVTHIFLLFTDHFEPSYDADRVSRWAARYVALASRHRDGDGRPPQHTFFYPGEQYQPDVLRALQRLSLDGYGEVELHLHHSRDTEASLRMKLTRALERFQEYGFSKTVNGETRFAFIHGNFGLDDSIPKFCGVPTEVKLLSELGCFADFSFPSVYRRSQPNTVNRIFAVKDDPLPKSYNRPLPVSALLDGSADLMEFEGPLVFAPSLHLRRLFLDLDDGNVHVGMPASPERVERWLRANVHAPGRPDWIFIKLWAHGVSSDVEEDEVVGSRFDAMLDHLERAYNDGTRYALHYITAREAYNLAIAAAKGASGPPELYMDTPVAPYISSARPEIIDARRRAACHTDQAASTADECAR